MIHNLISQIRHSTRGFLDWLTYDPYNRVLLIFVNEEPVPGTSDYDTLQGHIKTALKEGYLPIVEIMKPKTIGELFRKQQETYEEILELRKELKTLVKPA